MKTKLSVLSVFVLLIITSVLSSISAFAQAPVTAAIRQVPLVSFTGVPFTQYGIQYATDLNSGVWQQLAIVSGNETGVYDYVDKAATNGARFYRIQSLGSSSIVIVRSGLNSLPDHTARISKASQTDVLLGNFDIAVSGPTAQNDSLTLQLLTTLALPSELFSSVRINVANNGQDYYGSTITGNGTVVFNNLNITQPSAGSWVRIAVYGTANADVQGALSGATVSVKFTAGGTLDGTNNNPVVIDTSTFHVLPVATNMLQTSTITLTSAEAALSGLSTSVGAAIVQGDFTVAYPISFTYTVNAMDTTIYMSSDSSISLALSGIGLTMNMGSTVVSPASAPGDVGQTLVIQPGTSRTFTNTIFVSKTGGGTGVETLSVLAIYMGTRGTSPSDLTEQAIKTGLAPLSATVTF